MWGGEICGEAIKEMGLAVGVSWGVCALKGKYHRKKRKIYVIFFLSS